MCPGGRVPTTKAPVGPGAASTERIHGHAGLSVAGLRRGATGRVRMYFDARSTRFSDLAVASYGDDGYE